MFIAYFIHFHFANSRFSPEYSLCGANPPSIMEAIFIIVRLAHEELLLICGGLSPLSGGDSENNTRSSRGRANRPGRSVQGAGFRDGSGSLGGPAPTVARFFFAAAQQQVAPVQQLARRNNSVGIGHLRIVHVGAALATVRRAAELALGQTGGNQQLDDAQVAGRQPWRTAARRSRPPGSASSSYGEVAVAEQARRKPQ